MEQASPLKINVLMMQKDEGELLKAWLHYYSHLFGWSFLHIVDNGSTDPKTLSFLEDAEKRGASIYWDCGTLKDYHAKHIHLSHIIHSLDASQKYDFALPVDCDEFLAVFTKEGISTEKEDILAHFEELKGIKQAFRIDMSLFNVPEKPDWYAPVRSFHKGFVPAYSLNGMDHGQHEPSSKLAEGVFHTRFSYLHEHNCDYETLRRRHQRKLVGILDDPEDMEEVSKYAQTGTTAIHLVKALLLSKAEYLAQYEHDLQVHVPKKGTSSLLSLPEINGGKTIGRHLHKWDEAFYQKIHLDVAGFHSTGLHHFIRHGFEEGRAFSEE